MNLRWPLTVERWSRAWRAAVYLLVQLVSAPVGLVLLVLLLVATIMIVVAGIGFALVPLTFQLHRRWADLHRRLAGWILGVPIAPKWQPFRIERGSWMRQVIADPTTWRDLRWVVLQLVLGFALGLVGVALASLPLEGVVVSIVGLAAPDSDPRYLNIFPIDNWFQAIAVGVMTIIAVLPLVVLALPLLAGGTARLMRRLLTRSIAEELSERVGELTETRAGVVDAHGAELRRIERDLHDGTQAQLVSIAMKLGVAQQAMVSDPELAEKLIKEARLGAEAAMRDLRVIVRTMYPPILADRGLVGAVRALAAQSVVPTQVAHPDDLGVVPAAVEAAAYFVIAESLTNVAKHADASSALVTLTRTSTNLRAEIKDNGRGTVDAASLDEGRGSGIAGMRRRVAALDGVLDIVAGSGTGTMIMMELPCASS